MRRPVTISLLVGIVMVTAGCSESPIDDGSARVILPPSSQGVEPEGHVRVLHRIKTQGTAGLGEQEIDLEVLADGSSKQGSVTLRDGRPVAVSMRFVARLPQQAQVSCKQSALRWLRVSLSRLELDAGGRGAASLASSPDRENGVGAIFQFAENLDECYVCTGSLDSRPPSLGTFTVDSVRSKNGTWIVDGRLTASFNGGCPSTFQKMRISDMKVTLTY